MSVKRSNHQGTNIHVITADDWSDTESYQLHTDILRNGSESHRHLINIPQNFLFESYYADILRKTFFRGTVPV
jgi:hypothetical protein